MKIYKHITYKKSFCLCMEKNQSAVKLDLDHDFEFAVNLDEFG